MSASRKNKVFIYNNKWVKPLLVIIASFFFLSWLFFYGTRADETRADNIRNIYSLIEISEDNYAAIIEQVLPGYTVLGHDDVEWDALTRHFLFNVTGVDSRNPRAILNSELNLCLAKSAVGPTSALAAVIEVENGEEDFYLPGQDDTLEDWTSVSEDQFGPVQLNGAPMVLIYNTHNAESYLPSDGASKFEGKNGGVAVVAKTLSQTIESKHSIKTLYTDVIHDYPDFTKSYINSMQTVKQLLQKNDKIQMVIDIHRDAGLDTRSDTLVKIGNKSYAKVMIVVGKEHPRWQDNLAFAEKIEAMANKLYPGLIKCVRALEDRRYNQHLHPRALLMEFGSELNTREDAMNSAVLMAEVIAKVLKN